MNEQEIIDTLSRPRRLYSRTEILARASPVPRKAGLYAWFFREIPHGVPLEGCTRSNGLVLLYVGISPKAPPRNGKRPSRQTLWNRVRYHMQGNAYGSTLRLTLGCLLADELGIALRRVGSGKRLTFAEGEHELSLWLESNAFVTWTTHPTPWIPEPAVISSLSLPLNLDHNRAHGFYLRLKQIRAEAREKARVLPIAAR